jgi:hypothetical protein
LVVAVSGQVLKLGNPEAMPVQARDAIATDGRSEAARVAQLDDPTNCVMLGRSGYLPAVLGWCGSLATRRIGSAASAG